ncbi:unnamed protein product [Musa banksii]
MIAMFGSNVRVEDATARTSSCTGLAVVPVVGWSTQRRLSCSGGNSGKRQVWKITYAGGYRASTLIWTGSGAIVIPDGSGDSQTHQGKATIATHAIGTRGGCGDDATRSRRMRSDLLRTLRPARVSYLLLLLLHLLPSRPPPGFSCQPGDSVSRSNAVVTSCP